MTEQEWRDGMGELVRASAQSDQEGRVLQATRESLELRELMLWGFSEAVEKVS